MLDYPGFDYGNEAAGSRVVIVSGLPRSGTSMMMRMLAFGGIEPLTDDARARDSRNPHGYYEWERIKDRLKYVQWMNLASGKALKVVSRFVTHLPATHCYDILFIHRDLDEVLRSQADLAHHFSESRWDDQTSHDLKSLYRRHVEDTLEWVVKRPNMRLHELRYDAVLSEPAREVRGICDFLSNRALQEDRMIAAIDPALDHSASGGRKRHA